MYAVICSPIYWKDIEQAVDSMGEEILVKAIDTDIDISSELNKISRVAIKHLIIDITSISDEKRFVQTLMQYRIRNEKIQIIIIAPNCLPGNELIHKLVTQVHVYDVIAPKSSEDNEAVLLPSIIEIINRPSTYKESVRWIIDNDTFSSENEESKTKEVTEVERTVIKDKIVGTVVISVAGTMKRVGVTHTALSITKFLKDENFKVAVLELHNANNFKAIHNAYEDIVERDNCFSLDGIDYYPYREKLNVLDVLQEDYNYIILDMGVYNQCNIEEFKRSHVRIITSGVKDWELTDLELILRTNDTIYKNNYYFTFSDDYTFDLVKENMDQLKCFKAPFNPNPFTASSDCKELFKKMLVEFLPEIQDEQSKNGLTSKLNDIYSRFRKKGGEDAET